jgi:mercuric ion transport protein
MSSLWLPYNRLRYLPEDEEAYCMNNAQLLKTGLMGSIMAALCCFTPVLAVLLGAVGLGWFIGYLDYVLVPVRVIFLGLVSYAVWRNAKKAR